MDRLRRHLEAALATGPVPADAGNGDPGPVEVSGRRGPSVPLLVTRERLRRALACATHAPAGEGGAPRSSHGPVAIGSGSSGADEERPDVSEALVIEVMMGIVFRQVVTTGQVDTPFLDARSVLAIDPRHEGLLNWLESQPLGQQRALQSEVDRQGRDLMARWPRLHASWLPRTDQAMRVELADGQIELLARADLAVGRPVSGEATVALVDVLAGTPRPGHRHERHLMALVEALRWGTPPFVVATYYTRTGALEVEPVTELMLASAARRLIAGVRVLRTLGPVASGAVGGGIRPASSVWCGSCAAEAFSLIDGPAGVGSDGDAPSGEATAEGPFGPARDTRIDRRASAPRLVTGEGRRLTPRPPGAPAGPVDEAATGRDGHPLEQVA